MRFAFVRRRTIRLRDLKNHLRKRSFVRRNFLKSNFRIQNRRHFRRFVRAFHNLVRQNRNVKLFRHFLHFDRKELCVRKRDVLFSFSHRAIVVQQLFVRQTIAFDFVRD